MKRITSLIGICLMALALMPLISSVQAKGYAPFFPGRGRSYKGIVQYRDRRTMWSPVVDYTSMIIWWTDGTYAYAKGITKEGTVYMAEGPIEYITYGYLGACDKYVFHFTQVTANGHPNVGNGYGVFYDFYVGSDKVMLIIPVEWN